MKLTKPTGKSLAGVLETGAGVIVGAKLSKGISEIIPLENKSISKGIVIATGILAASAITGNDTFAKLAKNAAIGMAAQQGGELIDELVQPVLPEATGTGTKFVNDVFGGAKAVPAANAGLGFGSDAFLAGLRNPMPMYEAQPMHELEFATA